MEKIAASEDARGILMQNSRRWCEFLARQHRTGVISSVPVSRKVSADSNGGSVAPLAVHSFPVATSPRHSSMEGTSSRSGSGTQRRKGGDSRTGEHPLDPR